MVKDNFYGFIDEKGAIKIPIDIPYQEGVLNWGLFNKKGYARVVSEDKFGLIDKLGVKFIPALFEDIGEVSEHLIAIKRKGKWGYCDYETKLKIPYNFESATGFDKGVALVKIDGEFGLILSLIHI